MTETLRLRVKLMTAAPLDAAPLIPLFHELIRAHALDELLIDVADYRHVPQGPQVLLVGHGSDYAYDTQGGRPGLFVHRKRGAQGSLTEQLVAAIRKVAELAARVQLAGIDGMGDPTIGGRRLEIQLFDRRHGLDPGTLEDAIRDALAVTHGEGPVSLEPLPGASAKQVWGVAVQTQASPPLEAIAGA